MLIKLNHINKSIRKIGVEPGEMFEGIYNSLIEFENQKEMVEVVIDGKLFGPYFLKDKEELK
jgi:hypothetical protein